MKKFLLFLPVLGIGLLTQAQQSYRDNKLNMFLQDGSVVTQHNNHYTPAATTHQHRNGGGRALSAVLHSQRIGSAGNMLSVLQDECNQIDVNDSLNVVTFIHRNDPFLLPGSNVAQYRYDASKDRGLTWTNDIGPITNDISIDNVSVNGRFPQALIYNPAGNTNVDSAYLIYSGTWHDNNTWSGEMRGRGQLSGDTASFNVHIDPVNNQHVSIANGLTQGAPGVFWNVNTDYTGTFTAGTNAITSGLIVYKGVWNNSTKDVDWTNTTIPQTFVVSDNGGSQVSVATSQQIAFDPSGQFGWISILGDIVPDNDSVYTPIFWNTTDGGQTWNGPIVVSLDSIQGLLAEMNPTLVNGDPASMNPTTSFDADLTVDVNGNPHLLVIVGSGDSYSIQAAGYDVWDITYDAGAVQGCNWKGIHLADIMTLRGTFTNDATPYTEDNRPQVSRSADGSKVFFFWNESDFTILQSTDNDIPNLFGRAIDVVQNKMTPVYNFTEGDTLWGGETANSGGGVFGGAVFPVASQKAWENGSNWNVPYVMTQIDYNHDPSLGLGSGEQPAAFWYINNIDFPTADFNQPLDQVPPSITLNGPDTVTVLVNNSYTELGATAFDCTDGAITPTIQNVPDTAQIGIYNVLYIATDAAGNSDTVTRVVIVGAIPVSDFTWSFPSVGYKAQFQDLSINMPTSWLWTFGDGGGSVLQNPIHTYAADGTYNVCLTVSNSFGSSSQVCHDVVITQVGINETEFSTHLGLFPNPANGKVFITVEGDFLPEMTVSVYNVLGELVKEPVTYGVGTAKMELNMSDVTNGLYLVKIQSIKGTAVKPLTISHK